MEWRGGEVSWLAWGCERAARCSVSVVTGLKASSGTIGARKVNQEEAVGAAAGLELARAAVESGHVDDLSLPLV